MNAELYYDDPIVQVSNKRQGALAPLIGRFDQFKKDAELPNQCVAPDIYWEINSENYRVNPILREIERCEFYLYRSNDEWLHVSLTPPKALLTINDKLLSLADKPDVASRFRPIQIIQAGFKKLLPRRIGGFKASATQALPQPWREQVDEEYHSDDLVVVEQKVSEFHPSNKLVNLVLQSRQEMLLEQDKVLDMLRHELKQDEFAEISAALQADSTNSMLRGEEVNSLIEQEVRLFVETIGNLGFDHTSAKHFLLTRDHASKFLPSIENAILLPFHLTTDNKPPFLRHLLDELKPIAATGKFCTAHGKLTMLKGELVVERQDVEPFDLFSSNTTSQHHIT